MNVVLSAGDLTLGKVNAAGTLALRTGAGNIVAGNVAAGTLDLSSSGALTAMTIKSNGGATLAGGSIAANDVSAGTLAIRTPGALTGLDGARASLIHHDG